jgi:hypothetical protein
MKPTIILVLTAVAVAAVAFLRQGRLTELKQETRMLESQSSVSPSVRSRQEPDEEQPDAPAAQVELVCGTMVEAFIAFQDRSRHGEDYPERMKRLLLAAKDLSARDMAKVMNALFNDTRIAGVERDDIIRGCHEVLGGAAPFAWREYLISHRELPDWQNCFEDATRQCMQADEERTLAMIEQEKSRGNPEVATTGIRQSVLLALAASDPDKMLTLAVSPELAADPDALAHLGGFVDDQLKKPDDHQRFFDALRRAQEKNPSPVLETIRKDYVRELSNRLDAWPPDEAIPLIDSEFTSAERFQFAEQCASRGDLTEPDKWIDWFLKIDPAEWAAWSKQQYNRYTHPLVRQIASRSLQDADLPAKWLEKIPPGPLRDEATLEYAWMIANRDPERAASYLDRLPQTKGKQNLVGKIKEARQENGSPAQ